MASLYAHTAWSSGNLAVNAGAPAAGDVSRPRAIAACRRQRQPGTADGTPAAPGNRGMSAAPAARSGRRHAGGPKWSRRVSGIGRSRHPASLARHLRLCGNGRSFLDFPEENDEMTWHFSLAPSRGPILIWETAGRLIAVKRSTLRSSFFHVISAPLIERARARRSTERPARAQAQKNPRTITRVVHERTRGARGRRSLGDP